MIKLTDKPVVLVVGNETIGASDEFMKCANVTVQIPMHGEVESLNIGVTTGTSIYELKLKRVIGMIEKQFGITYSEIKNYFQPLLESGFILKNLSDNFVKTETGVETIGKFWTTIENTEKTILEDFTEAERQECNR